MSADQLHRHVSEDVLHALLDRELSGRESDRIAEHVGECTRCATMLDECRETRTAVGDLLASFDNELARQPQVTVHPDTSRRIASPVTGAPIIRHIVAKSRASHFWPALRQSASLAAVALVFAGTASLFMVRGYNAVSKSVNTFAAGDNRTYGATPMVKVTGVVSKAGGRAIENARVTVDGTQLHASTNVRGEFSLYVPERSVVLQVSAIGYQPAPVPLDLGKSSAVNIEVTLQTLVHSMDAFVVTSPSVGSVNGYRMCLRAASPETKNHERVFSELNGMFRAKGEFSVQVVGWPTPARTSYATFTADAPDAITGAASAGSYELRVVLTRDGASWRGSATESREGVVQWRRIALQESTCGL
ncbi:MAG: carboxypeptidase-like regulatory domain-containing protein [Gemmatimonas sp.]